MTAAIAMMVTFNFVACTNVESGSTSLATHHTDQARGADTNNERSSNNPVDQPSANEVEIVIENFVFAPSELTITPGTRVTWINKDEAPHTATSTDKKFNSGGLDTDDRFSFVFNDKGEFPYFCALHPHMTATITVK